MNVIVNGLLLSVQKHRMEDMSLGVSSCITCGCDGADWSPELTAAIL